MAEIGIAGRTQVEVYNEDAKLVETHLVQASEIWTYQRSKPEAGTFREITTDVYVAKTKDGIERMKKAYPPNPTSTLSNDPDVGCSILGRSARLLVETAKGDVAHTNQIMIHVGNEGPIAGTTAYLIDKILVLPETEALQASVSGKSGADNAFYAAFVESTKKMSAIMAPRREKAKKIETRRGTDEDFD